MTTRFEVDDITNGRTTIFQAYNDFLRDNPSYIPFGAGLLFHRQITELRAIHNGFQQVLVSWGIVGCFIIAIMIINLYKAASLSKKFEPMYLLPMIMSMVSTVLIFKFIFSPEQSGVLNYFLGLIGVKPQLWLASTSMSRESVVLMSLWKNLGYNVILFFAGLQSIPGELYEAATIDGANEGKRIWYITLPCVKNTVIFVYITTCISVLKRFADVFALSREYGLPGTSLMTIMLYIYRYSFATMFAQNYGVASAACVTLFVLIMAITAINLFTTDRDDTGAAARRIRRRGK